MLHITPPKVYHLNQGQQAAADAFMDFLFSDEKEFNITGPAGVGKTYLMDYIIDTTMPRYHEMCRLIGLDPKYDSVHMTATTNKAAEVLGQSVNRPTSTIHSFFGLVVYDDYATGNSVLRRTRKWRIHEREIIFIDEASMIDTPLWKELQDSTKDCKLVYVGDRSQLAPVQEDLSPVYKRQLPMAELLTPVRNASQPALLNVCQQLRETVSTGVFKPIQIVPGVIDLLDDQAMQAEIANHFQAQTHDVRILAYTNKRVIAFNDHIRGLRQLPTEYKAGEFLINNSVLHHKNGTLAVEAEVEVIRNLGPSRKLVDEEHQVYLDLNILDLQTAFGDIIRNVQFATNRQHLTDLIKYYSRTKNFPVKFDLQNNIADLRPRDAATVHKSQGSTYDAVFVDLGNISTCNSPNQAARMLYVAFSRAKSRVFLYGDLAPKYGGLRLS
jgi:GTPase SAR1 family protein